MPVGTPFAARPDGTLMTGQRLQTLKGTVISTSSQCSWTLLQFQENSTEREQLGQRLIAGCQQQPRGRNAALCAIRLRSNATDHGRVHRLSSCMTGSMLSKRPSLAPRKDLLELETEGIDRAAAPPICACLA